MDARTTMEASMGHEKDGRTLLVATREWSMVLMMGSWMDLDLVSTRAWSMVGTIQKDERMEQSMDSMRSMAYSKDSYLSKAWPMVPVWLTKW